MARAIDLGTVVRFCRALDGSVVTVRSMQDVYIVDGVVIEVVAVGGEPETIGLDPRRRLRRVKHYVVQSRAGRDILCGADLEIVAW